MKDLNNKRFGKLLIKTFANTYTSPKGQTDPIWECQCDCGKIKTIRQSKLLNKTRPTLSCGCLRLDALTINRVKHGDTGSRLYSIWHGMKDRCNNSYNDKNKHYYGKNIKVCDEWSDSYISFKDWSLNNGYSDVLTIDRINSEGNYSPYNCKWSSMQEQQNNKSNNKFIVAFGETKTLANWLRDDRCKIGRESLKDRLKNKWDAERAISTPPRPRYVKPF